MSTEYFLVDEPSCCICNRGPDRGEPVGRRTGIALGVCRFTFEIEPHLLRGLCTDSPYRELIVDEYGVALTGAEFLEMLEKVCPGSMPGESKEKGRANDERSE